MRLTATVPLLLLIATALGCQRDTPTGVASTTTDAAPAPSSAPPQSSAVSEHSTADDTFEGRGRVAAIDAGTGTVTLEHDAIAELGWPARTMTFDVEGEGMSTTFDAGDPVSFTLRQGKTGRLVVTDVQADSLATADTTE